MKYYTLRDYVTCIELLEDYEKIFRNMSGWEKEADALKMAAGIIAGEKEEQADSIAHSEVTLEMELGREIPLGEWARKNGIDESYARHKARRGNLKTAHKIGRDWFISELEENIDNRFKR